MNSEVKSCQNCKKNFTIDPDDFSFYEKMKVNVPDFCPSCGLGRLAALRNERIMYWRNCDKCDKKTMSLYHPNSTYVVYCHDCWWGDDWDGFQFGVKYDPSLPLVQQIKVLQKIVPREALIILNSTNCDYGNNVRDSKNCFFTFLCSDSENILYSMFTVSSKDCMDNYKIVESEFIVYSLNVTKCYKSAYLQDSSDCSFCYFSFDLKNCNDCIFCCNLRNKSYCIGNKQFSKEEYQKEYKKIFNGSFNTLVDSIKKFEDIKMQAVHKFATILKSSDVVGNYIQNSNRNRWCFDGVENQDVRYVANILYSKNTYFSYAIGVQPTEFIFGGSVIKGGSMIKNSFNLFNCSFCTWCDSMISCNNCIACVGLKKKEYCILNKQYTKEEYKKIVEQLEEKGELASFVGPEFSTFAYNETAAQDHYPITKEKALSMGYGWQEDIPFTIGQETISIKDIPDNIKSVKDSIVKEIFICQTCQRNYKIVTEELRYLREFLLPLPHECPQCRIKNRMKMRLPFRLWHRTCMCENKNHFHGKEKCEVEFETSYAPERPEIVYCEKCYQQEIY
jgi:hypothetical protein